MMAFLSTFAIISMLCTLGYAAATETNTTSLIKCNDTTLAFTCDAYYKNMETDDVLRCKNRTDSSMSCTADYCCTQVNGLLPCDAVVTCSSGYKSDPKIESIMRCKNRTDTSIPCDTQTCCTPPEMVECGSEFANVTCKYGYKKDPKTEGVMRCKTKSATKIPCDTETCCEPKKPFVLCSDAVECKAYFASNTTGTVLQCKEGKGKKTPCTKEYCCEA